MYVKCFVTEKDILKEESESHHILPVSLGGEHSKQVYLSTEVHKALHKSSKNKKFKDLYISKLNPKAKSKFLFLLKVIEVAYIEGKEPNYKKINLEIPIKLHKEIKLICKETKITQNDFIIKSLTYSVYRERKKI